MQNSRTVHFDPPLVMPLESDAPIPRTKEPVADAKRLTAVVTLESWVDPENGNGRVLCDRCFAVEGAGAELTVGELVRQVADEWQRLSDRDDIDQRRNQLKAIDIQGRATCWVHFVAPAGVKDGRAVGRLDPHARYGLR